MKNSPDASLRASSGASAGLPALDPPPPGRLSAPGRPDTRWQQTLHEARAAPAHELLTSQLLGLSSWPNLSWLPQDITGPVTRICALLWRQHTAGLLIHKGLALPAHDTLVLLTVLQRLGHVETARGALLRHASPDTAASRAAPALPSDSLLGKLWQRLKAGD